MRKLILLLICIIVTSCAIPIETPEQGLEVTEYTIGASDELDINVWQNASLSRTVAVRPDGKISVPLIGDVIADGLTTEELAKNITFRLKKYIRNPEVTVIVTAANSAEFLTRVRITGAIQAPQSISYRQGMTVLDLVLQAGGLTPFADGDGSILYRKTKNGTKPYSVRLDSIIKKGDIKTNYELRPSDILIVPESIF